MSSRQPSPPPHQPPPPVRGSKSVDAGSNAGSPAKKAKAGSLLVGVGDPTQVETVVETLVNIIDFLSAKGKGMAHDGGY
ncbi:hypothetical protein W97_08687 [Coniosporium apollinis CBS 100218]|uniref:Uncharacterized protein n=1 Tax=Coniosporium apollinis (strain CBS 100218) TaxID=1168221 RepID=R7Z5I1_CONA1|nr:uncharacterized protein W97_08687 [Coniosporium apollinis CBS 100218]EON69427.1 hypothetical protein W97_08687 [Coniosporium apollinis CBS 100218]